MEEKQWLTCESGSNTDYLDWFSFRGLCILPVSFRREVFRRDIHEGCTGPHQVAWSHVTRGRKSPWHHLVFILHTVDKSTGNSIVYYQNLQRGGGGGGLAVPMT